MDGEDDNKPDGCVMLIGVIVLLVVGIVVFGVLFEALKYSWSSWR